MSAKNLEALIALRIWHKREIRHCDVFAQGVAAGHNIPIGVDMDEVALFFPPHLPEEKEGEQLCNVERYRHMIGHAVAEMVGLYRLLLVGALEKIEREIEQIEVTEAELSKL
jgi:hypothetical protein